ncbi:tRNA (32-2'-O)-methyltransferase regulator THADA-like isoform X2 [Acropora muricata]|uniref:tRNA (32-2'-O)-methyltransferase regulator THADA-like isoform X2 n=1 Tax=Acropora muricata TaxID=159855 RepID=UPI0034E548EE
MKKQKKVYTQKLVVSEASTRELQAMTMYESGNLAEVSQLLNQCLQEDDSIKQCTLLKKAGALLQGPNWKSGEVFSSDLGKCLTFLAEVFVICDIKNPSRKVIASTFDNLPVHWCSDVFSNVFLDKLKEVSKEILELGKTPSVRHDVDLISDMLEYFSLVSTVISEDQKVGPLHPLLL